MELKKEIYELLKKWCNGLLTYQITITHDDLLYGGRDLKNHGEAPCIHHTFTHVNGLLTTLEWLEDNLLPKFKEKKASHYSNSRYFKELDLYIHDKDGFRAAITAFDLITDKENCMPRGGALSILYHKTAGLLCTSSMTVYKRYELQNTQRNREDTDMPLTPRLEYRASGIMYSSIQDRYAILTRLTEDKYYCEGIISDETGKHPFEKDIHYMITYTFTKGMLCIDYVHTDEKNRLDFHFPVIVEKEDFITITGIHKKKGVVNIQSTTDIKLNYKRIFNLVPGFEAVDYYVNNVPQKFCLCLKIE